MYNYKQAMKNDIQEAIKEKMEYENLTVSELDFDDLYDEFFISDNVTGNASGSYTFNTCQAEQNLVGNWDLISETCEAFGSEVADLKKGAEYWDVSIRCYLLGEVLQEVLDDMQK